MKKIDINEMKVVLNNLLDYKISREEAANWALKLREAVNKNCIEFFPKECEHLLWEGIVFVEGIDLQDAPNSYLHNEEDIRIFLGRILEKDIDLKQ